MDHYSVHSKTEDFLRRLRFEGRRTGIHLPSLFRGVRSIRRLVLCGISDGGVVVRQNLIAEASAAACVFMYFGTEIQSRTQLEDQSRFVNRKTPSIQARDTQTQKSSTANSPRSKCKLAFGSAEVCHSGARKDRNDKELS